MIVWLSQISRTDGNPTCCVAAATSAHPTELFLGRWSLTLWLQTLWKPSEASSMTKMFLIKTRKAVNSAVKTSEGFWSTHSHEVLWSSGKYPVGACCGEMAYCGLVSWSKVCNCWILWLVLFNQKVSSRGTLSRASSNLESDVVGISETWWSRGNWLSQLQSL